MMSWHVVSIDTSDITVVMVDRVMGLLGYHCYQYGFLIGDGYRGEHYSCCG